MKKVVFDLTLNQKDGVDTGKVVLAQVELCLDGQKKYFLAKLYLEDGLWSLVLDSKQSEFEFVCGDDVAFLDGSRRKENTISFSRFMKDEIEVSNLKQSTLRNHMSTLQVLSAYKAEVAFKDLDFRFLFDFEHYMKEHHFSPNTIAKHMKHLKRYINLAINKDLFNLYQYPFRNYKIKYVDSKRSHLTPEELLQLESLDLSNSCTLRHTLDMFLFSCYTGLRFSDVVSLTRDNFLCLDGKLWLIYSSKKTDVHVRLPLYLLFAGKAVPIYERYKNNPDTLFDMSASSNSNVNKQIKRICNKAHINKRVSFHTARHTNATLLLYNGANITTVQKLLGHKSVRTTEIYSDIMDMTVVRDLSEMSSMK